MNVNGTTEEGQRNVLLTEELFTSIVEELAEHQGKEFDIEWGTAQFGTFTYFAPTVYVVEEEAAEAPA
jgi:hypothetical protein